MSMPAAGREYLKSRVQTASPEQLQLMLLDGAIRFTQSAIDAVRAKRIEDGFNNFDRAQKIVLALMQGLRRDVNPQIVDQMTALYDFTYDRLVRANLTRDEALAGEALQILRHQRETWALLMEKLARERAPRPAVDAAPARTSVLSIEG